MPKSADTPARGPDRHSHISIPLQLVLDSGHHRIQALGWNAAGFNFHFEQPLNQTPLVFRRGMLLFEAQIAWRAEDASDAAWQATLVNELVYKHAQRVSSDASLHRRLLKLIRAPGMVAQKLQVLASLGLPIDDAKLAELLHKRRAQRQLYQYGVRVRSEAWAALTQQAYGMSSAVLELEKWSRALVRNRAAVRQP